MGVEGRSSPAGDGRSNLSKGQREIIVLRDRCVDLMVAGGTSGVHLVEITDGEYATGKGANILERVIENLGVQWLSKCSNRRCTEL